MGTRRLQSITLLYNRNVRGGLKCSWSEAAHPPWYTGPHPPPPAPQQRKLLDTAGAGGPWGQVLSDRPWETGCSQSEPTQA